MIDDEIAQADRLIEHMDPVVAAARALVDHWGTHHTGEVEWFNRRTELQLDLATAVDAYRLST